MTTRINKPKVFLSHSWENKQFIEKIAADLRRCGIDYWLDKEEIRDGRPWLKMIFEDGIPTCDAVIVYLTEQSIRSQMVQKELDAAVVQQLSEGGVTLLPYVSEAESQYSDRWETVYEFSEKMYRFKYWIEYNVLLEDEPLEHVVTLSRPESTVNQEQLEYDRATAQALKADKRISETRRKKTWSSNGEGTLAATKAVQTLFDDLKKRVAASNKVVQNMKLDFHADINSCSVVANGVALTMKWNCPSNKITDCCIRAEVNILSAEPLPETSTQQVFLQHFVPRTDNELQVFWHDKGGSRGSPYSLLEIADLCWRNFFSAVQRNEEENN